MNVCENKQEIWHLIQGWENYSISNQGRVKNNKTNKIRATYINNSGYECVLLYDKGKHKHFLIHRLVADGFIPNPNHLSEINHKDENKLNNYDSNLEWTSHKENCLYGQRNIKTTFKKSRPIICIETQEEFLNATEIKNKYGYDNSLIHKCCKGVYKQAYGYHWEYKEENNG